MNLDGFIRARVDLGFLDRARALLTRPDLRPAWREVRKPFRADLADHRKRREGPDGPWAPRASSTKTRTSGRKRARRLLGRLPTAIVVKTDRGKLTATSRVRWSAIHQDGGRAGHGARIPARTFLWASERFLELAGGAVARRIARLIEGR